MRKISQIYRYTVFVLIALFVITAVAVIRFGLVKASSEKKPAPPTVEHEFFPTPQAAVAGRATVHAATRTTSGIRLSNGSDLQTIYSGDANAISALNSGPVQSLSLASDDLNNDGAPDVLAGYSANGRGVITMYRGNVDGFAPTSEAVYQAVQSGRIPASFDSTVQVLDVPEPADFIVTGDFNHDGKKDILAGARGGGLYLMTGDGQGKFGTATSISLPGQITGLAAGELNKADGQPDVAVGIIGQDGPAVLVFDGRTGGITGRPAKYNLSSAATALAFDTLDNDQYSDLAIAAGNEVVILHGQSAQAEHINVGFNIQSLTLGEFTWNRDGKKSMALLGDDGAIHLLERSDLDTRPFTGAEAADRKINAIKNANQPTTPRAGITRATPSTTKGKVNVQWSLTTQFQSGNNAAAKQTLMSSQISAREVNDLLVIDQTGNRINLVSPSGDQQNRTNATSADNSAVTMSVDGSPSAALAMRKKVNGQRDLVVLRAGQITPSLMTATGQTTITVNRTDYTRASVCAGRANDCSLRGAIDFANVHPGTTINLPAGTYDLTAASTFENSNANGDLDINASGTTIVGAGAGSTIIRQTVTDRVFNVNFASSANFSFNLSGVTVQGGNDRSDLGGGAILLGGPSNDYSITNCTFDSNTATNATGGAISMAFGGNLNLMSNTFTNNGAGATRGGAISLGDGNVVAHFNRFVNNVVANAVYGNDVYASAGTGDFTNNWWANIGGPNTGDAVGKGGVLTTSPSLTLVLKTEKSSVAANSSTPITASFRNGTNGDPINTANLGALIGLPITFDAKAGTIGDSDVNIQGSATASASVTLANSDVATATVDGATASVTISAVPAPPPTISIAFGAASIPVNATTSLTFTITFPAFTYSNVSLTDNLPSGMVVANPANLHINGSCSPSVGATSGSNQVNVFIGTEVGSAVCTISLDVTPSTNGIKTNTTGAITSDESGPGGTATATLHVNAPPVLDVTFSQPSVRTTQPSGLQITITNPASNPDALTNVSLTAHVPTGLHVNNASQTPVCPAIGAGPQTGTVTLTNPDTITLTGASIAPNTFCQVTIAIRTDARGQYTISFNASSDNGGTGNTDSANLTVSDAPTVTSSFSGPTVTLNGTTTLTLNITNPNTTSLSSLAFTDTLPSGLLVAGIPGLTNTCGGTATATANSNKFSLTNGGLAGGASCSISVAIQGTTAGVKNNSVQVNSSEGGPSTTSASITVVSPPVIIKAFGAASIPLNGTTTLTFTIQNNNASTGITGVAFTDNLPAGLKVSTPNGLSGSCGSGTITATPGTGNVSLSGGTIAANSSCSFSISVDGITAGAQSNTTSNVTSTEGGTGNTSNASITVVAPPVIIKAFGAASIPLNGTTTLTLTIQNNNATTVLNSVGFTDNFPAGLVVDSTINIVSNTCSSGPIAIPGASFVSLFGQSLGPNSSCTFVVNVKGTTAGIKNNTTSNVTSVNGGTGGTASASVTVVAPNPPVIIKAFGAASLVVGDSTPLTFTVQNNNASANLTGIGFTDNLPAGLAVSTPNGLVGSCGGGTITALVGSGAVSLTGASIAQSAQCQFSINVTATTAGVKNNITSQVTATESGNGGTASASVTVNAPNPPVILKGFGAASIPLNGSTSLQFTIQNNNTTTILHGVGFTDTLPAGLAVSAPNGLLGSCGGGTITATPGSNTISLSGGTIGTSSSCIFTVNVTGTAAGIQNNTTGNVTSTEGGTGGTASASINVEAPPSISKTFNPSQIAQNATTLLSFTIGNPGANPDPLTGVGMTDTLPAGLTVSNASAPVCGGTLTVTAPNSITLSGATINPGDQCPFSVTVTGAAGGFYTNTTGNVTSTNGGTGNTATATLTVGAPPTIVKSFGSSSIPLNGTTALSFNIANPNAGLTLTGIAFTDNLPAGLIVASPPNIANTCGGVVLATPGSSAVSLSGGTLAPNANCTISVTVQGTTAGTKNNSVQVTSIEGGTGNTSNASITVVDPPVIIKAFGAASIPLNGTTGLQFTIQNNNTTTILHGVGFTDTFPAGLIVSNLNGLAGSCGGGTITATPGSNTVSLSGGTIGTSSSCTFTVNVTGTAAGIQNNTTGNVTSTEGGTGGTASASVKVEGPPSISKTFNPSQIALNATTSLQFTIANPAANPDPLTGVGFTDTLPTGLTVQNGSATACGGTVTLTAPNNIALSGATINPGNQCLFNITVTGAAGGLYTNTTGNVTSTNGGTGNTATATLTVGAPPTIVKSFGSNSIPLNGTTALSFNIANPNAGLTLTGIAFTDNLPAGLIVASTPNISNTCGGVVLATPGSSAVSLSGGTLAPNANCTVSVTVQGTTAGIKNNSVQVTSIEGGTGNTSSASITVVAPPVIIKAFGAASIPLNGSTGLQFTIQNNNTTTILHGVGFTDTLPAGLAVTAPNGLSGSCGGGTITATPGSNTVSLSGGTIGTSSSCTFTVNVTGTAAGIQNNTTGNVTSTEGGTGGTGSASVKVEGPPSISKTFNPSQIALNATTSLQFTLTNPAANPDPLSGVGFIDNLPVGLTVTNGSATVCGGPLTLTAPGSIVLSGATINPGSQCQFSVTVTGAASGQYNNISGTVTSANGGAGNTATASLTVAAPPTITKSFGAATMPVNATTPLTFTVNNPNNIGITGVAFTDNLPAGLVVSTPNGVTGNCGAGVITAVPGSSSISLSGGTIGSNASCTFSVNVTATFIGVKTNTTSPVTATETGAGGSASASITIITRTTSTAVSFSANPAVSGQTIQVTATVTDTDSGAQSNPVGTVTFTSGAGSDVINPPSCTLAAVALSNNTSACQVNLTSTTINTHSITANYPGVGVHAASSGSNQLTVNQANTASALVSSVNPSVFGQSVTITVTVTAVAPGAGIPTGSVTIFGFAPPGVFPVSVPLNASGVATQTFSNLAVGTYNVSAVYSGDANFNGGRSNLITQVVNKASTSTALASSVNPSSFGQNVTFTATLTAVAPGAGTPTGTVTFNDGATVLGTGTLAGGVATFSTANLSVGTHPITAVYNGDTNFTTSTSVVVNQAVNKSTSATALTSSANPSVFGQSVTFTANVTSTGPPVVNPGLSTRRVGRTLQTRTVVESKRAVTFGAGVPTGTVTFFDGTTQIGTGTLAGGVATFTTSNLSVGTHSITAVYSGDDSFQPSTSNAVDQVVNKANTSVATVASTINPTAFGQATVLGTTVTVVALGVGQPTGTVTFLDGAIQIGTVTINGSGQATLTVSSLAVGVHSIKATYNGDGNFNTSTSANVLTQTVGKANTTTTIVASSNPAFVSTTVTFTITVAPVAPGAGVPTGTLQLRDNGVNVGAPVALLNGVATATASNLTPGNHVFTAVYSGDASFNTSTGTLSGGLNVGFKFVDSASGNTLIVVPPANGQSGNGTWTWISNGTTIAANVPALIELSPTVLRIRSTNPFMEATFDATAHTGQAILFDRNRNQSFEINITNFALQ